MAKHLFLLMVLILCAGCASDGSRTAASAAPTRTLPVTAAKDPVHVVFFDSRAFDSDLSKAMRSESSEIVVDVPVGFNLNKIPERVDRWLYSVKDSGGAVVAEPEFKQRGVLSVVIDVVVSFFGKIDEALTFGPSERYGATLLYRQDGTVNKIVFRHRSAGPRAFVLVTPEEFAREQQQRDAAPSRSFDVKREAQSPDIVLVRPAAPHDILSPADIELRFLAKDQAQVDMRTLRVLYGMFGINITARLLKHASLTESSIVAKEASLPVGAHTITIEIADNRNRLARESFRFIVKEAKD
ncbi:MAG: hypothetical protein ACKVQU_31365 [Burkholderiales bacterium]